MKDCHASLILIISTNPATNCHVPSCFSQSGSTAMLFDLIIFDLHRFISHHEEIKV